VDADVGIGLVVGSPVAATLTVSQDNSAGLLENVRNRLAGVGT